MYGRSTLLRNIAAATMFAVTSCVATLAGAADKAKNVDSADAKADVKADVKADAKAAQPAQDFGALPDPDDNGKDKPKAGAKKKIASKAKKTKSTVRQQRTDKAARALRESQEQEANDLALQQQMQNNMMPQGNGMRQSRRGNNGYSNQSMFLLMRQFDANGNGQLDPQELQAMKLSMAQVQAGGPNVAIAQFLRQFDANGNGQLDPSEQAAAQRAMTQGVIGGQMPGGGAVLPNSQVLPGATPAQRAAAGQ